MKIDVPLKIGLTYRIKDIISIEFGLRDYATNFQTNSEIKRNGFYAGIKIPLS